MWLNDLVDINEDDLIEYDNKLLPILLKDHSSGRNIIWATDDYEDLGVKYQFSSEIREGLITGMNRHIIRPRVLKSRILQDSRSKEKAEVFSPSWICNKQNNLIDNEWFCREGVFNVETHNGWKTNPKPIKFTNEEGRRWQDYVKEQRLEICCGEAPYIVSRYDTTTGESIPVKDRIGILDRKFRVVHENTHDANFEEWHHWMKQALMATYAYEWQGDNLLLARENVLFSYIDYFCLKYETSELRTDILEEVAEIISWNLWQMDGLKGVIPQTCYEEEEPNLFFPSESHPCIGCQTGKMSEHNGVQCQIKDWSSEKQDIIPFHSLI